MFVSRLSVIYTKLVSRPVAGVHNSIVTRLTERHNKMVIYSKRDDRKMKCWQLEIDTKRRQEAFRTVWDGA